MSEKKPAAFQVRVNDLEFTFTQEDIDAASVIQLSDTEYHLLYQHRSINASLLDENETAKEQVLDIKGEKYAVQIKDELDQLLDHMGYSTDAGKHIKEIKAPMPGLVLEVHVTEGQQVKEGDKLLILVAMKMENSILAQGAGVVKHIAVTANQAVEKGQLLIELE
jgi:biotin carboxyl carrier protein